MGQNILTSITYMAAQHSSSSDMPYFMRFFMSGTRLVSMFITIGIWVVISYLISRKAREVGLSPVVHFVLPFFLHLIGLAISLVLIDKQKKQMFSQNIYRNQQPYGGYGQPQPPYGQNGYYGGQNYNQPDQRFAHPLYDDKIFNKPYGGMYGQQNYTGNPYNAQAIICPSCGHQQTEGNFCDVCGSKLR